MEIDRALRILSKKVDEAEIYFSTIHSQTVEVKKGKIEIFKETSSRGYGVRVIDDSRMGFAYSNKLDERVIERAVNAAKIAERDENLALPDKQKYKNIKGCYDVRLLRLDSREVEEYVEMLVEPCHNIGVDPTEGGIWWHITEVEIANTHGLWGRDKGTSISCHLSTAAKGRETASGFYYDISRSLDLDFRGIGEEAARLAKDSKDARRIGTKDVNLILKPHAVGELFENVLIPSFSADNVQRNRSILKGKLGQKLFSSFDIIDDGTIAGGLMSGKFDSEGVKTQRTLLVRKGVIEGYLYDTYCANKDNTTTTGNADRDSYSSIPRVDSSNFIIRGEKGIGDGLIVHGLIGAHTVNPVTGDFSLETRNAFYKGIPVRKAIISGNIFDLLARVEGFGEDVMQVSSVISPSIEFSKVRVVS
jgi:PmbA protein